MLSGPLAAATDNHPVGPGPRAAPQNFNTDGDSPFHVLFYEDFTLGTSIYRTTLDVLGWPYTRVSEAADLQLELTSGSFSHVIVVHQQTLGVQGFEAPLLEWIDQNPDAPVLISDWRVEDPSGYLGQLGFQFGSEAPDRLEPVEGRLFEGLAPATLTNPGWLFVWSYATLGGATLATDDQGTPVVARNGNVFFNGFLSDTFEDSELGVAYVSRQLMPAQQPLNAAHPIPMLSSWLVLLLALSFLAAGIMSGLMDRTRWK